VERDGGDGVRVLVRSEEAWRGKGGTVELVRGDLKDADSLVRACENVDTVVTTTNSAGRDGDDTVESVDRRGNRDLIEAAAHAGGRRFVFVSVLGASPHNPVQFVAAKGETEELLRGTDMNWTILEPERSRWAGQRPSPVQLVTGMETYDSVLDMDVIRATFDVRQTSLHEFVDGFVGGALIGRRLVAKRNGGGTR
jgi:hypothetical protein